MNVHKFTFCGATLEARASRSLWWPQQRILCVSDLHLGKVDRIFRRGGAILPPYENRDTIDRLRQEISTTGAEHVVCLGDSFDDTLAADNLEPEARSSLLDLAVERNWTWIAGNHDPTVRGLPGDWRTAIRIGPLLFQHIANPMETGEVSGHYHPKARPSARGAGGARACFLIDETRIILPAFGTYTGGLISTAPELCALMAPDSRAVLTGPSTHAIPMPRTRSSRYSAPGAFL